jgi:DNA polymerase eta
MARERLIIHVDLDCFYCQVEHLRTGLPYLTPMAVQQWQNVIAGIHYENVPPINHLSS